MSARGRGFSLAAFATSIVLSAAGQLAMKVGMRELHRSGIGELGNAHWEAIAPAVSWTLVGVAAYAVSMLAWLLVLARHPLSYAYPFLGASYVIVYAVATQWSALGEPSSPLRTLGTLLVVAGVVLVSSSGGDRAPR